MIRATIHDRAVWAYGHSGYGPKGQDIICAAVSVLMEAAAATLKTQSAPVLDIRGDGFWSLMAARDSGALEVARQGLCLLARHYGDYVEVRDLRTRRERHA